jgi:hypothetical protein
MRRPLLFLLLSFIVSAIVNPGNFGSIDTVRRLQVARWIWRGEPQVRPDDRDFGLVNSHGVRQAWYGIGQSLVLAPFDLLVSSTALPIARHAGLDPTKQQQVVELLVALLMQWLLTFAALSLTHAILIRLQFSLRAAMAGALSLLLATSYLFYVQYAEENNLLLLLALAALYGVLRCRDGGGARWAALAGCACGFAVLTRLPSLLEAGVFFALALSLGCGFLQLLKGYLPAVACAILADRSYQWYRFGSVLHTYMKELGEQLRRPGDPASFPFSYPFWKGFAGTLFSPDKSILLFDPLLLVLLALVLWKWHSIKRPVRLTLAWLAVLLLLYTVTYARYFDFGGDVAWAHRFVSLPVQLLAMFAVPLLITLAADLPKMLRSAAWVLVCASIVLQAASTTLAPNVEVVQRERGYDNGVIVNRAINLVQLARGEQNSPRFSGLPAEWRTLWYLPFQLRFRFPQFSTWAIAFWLALLAIALPTVLWWGVPRVE